ncbi:hypothetical protein BD408DRAFT_432925 [Parasitella parasitica]|nr:hypothetical protein BD408DRAFT_432925 [Parasitella parasitica]
MALKKQMERIIKNNQTQLGSTRPILCNGETITKKNHAEDNNQSNQERILVLEEILFSKKRTLTEVQAAAKINTLQETTKNLGSSIKGLQEKIVDLQAKQNNNKTILASMNRIRKKSEILESKLDFLEKNGEQKNSIRIKPVDKDLMKSKIHLFERAVFNTDAFELSSKVDERMKVIMENNRALEVKMDFFKNSLTNEANLRADINEARNRLETLEMYVGFNIIDREGFSKQNTKIQSI